LYSWGLIPNWAKDDSIRKNTLNAKIETIHEKPSFRDVIQHRCLVLIDGFYEWKWLDEKGKHK
jgi:putative SOS response-associated peptidase YedK